MIQIIFLVFVSITFSCNSSGQEIEPNNTQADATLIKHNNLRGRIHTANDIDFYTLSFAPDDLNKLLTIELIGLRGYDLELSLYEGGKCIKRADDYTKNKGERLDNILLRNSTYTIKVALSPRQKEYTSQHLYPNTYPSEEYTLLYQVKEGLPHDHEANDSLEDAEDILLGAVIEGKYSPFYTNQHDTSIHKTYTQLQKTFPQHTQDIDSLKGLELDIYRLRTQEKKQKARLQVTSPPEIDGLFFIIDATTHPKSFYYINNYGLGEAEQFANLVIQPGHTYYIGVAGIPNEYTSNPSTHYQYTLSVQRQVFTHLEEQEKNDTCNHANAMEFGTITGYISPKNDTDCYAFQVPQTQEHSTGIQRQGSNPPSNAHAKTSEHILNVTLHGIHNIDLTLHLYDQHKKLRKIYNSTQQGGNEHILNYALRGMKVFYLEVQGQSSHENIDTPYRLEVTHSQADPTQELEPNDYHFHKHNTHEDHPSPLEVNQMVMGRIDSTEIVQNGAIQKSDRDVYSIILEHNTNYQLLFRGIQGLELEVKMYQENGYPIKSFQSITTHSNALLSRKILETSEVFQAGKKQAPYYIEVRARTNIPTKQHYQITVTQP